MTKSFETMRLPDAPDAVAPDGSDVRVPAPGPPTCYPNERMKIAENANLHKATT